MSNSSQRTRSSSRHLNVASEARTSPRRQSRSSARQSSSLPFNLPRETRSSTRRQTNSCTNRETRSFTRRQLLARERRSRRAQIVPVRENQAARNIAHSDLNLVQQHFNRMRNRPLRLPSNNGISDEDSNSDKTPHGIQELTLPLLFSLQLLTCITIQTCIMNSTTFALTAIQCCGKKNGSTD